MVKKPQIIPYESLPEATPRKEPDVGEGVTNNDIPIVSENYNCSALSFTDNTIN